MHPAYTSDKPGDAPCCGMRMEPVYADAVSSAGQPFEAAALPPGAVRISPDKQQLMGIRTAELSKSAALQTIRTSGRVAADENRLYRLTVSSELWIRKVHPPTTGSIVRKDEPLLEFYTTNFFSAATAYMFALNSRDRQSAADPNNAAQLQALQYQMRQAVESLQNLGVSDADIAEMERTRKPRDLVTLRSPADGYIVSRTATMGQWVGSSSDLYQIADLSQVWVFADLFQSEQHGIMSGMPAKIVLPQERLTFPAQVGSVPPLWDESSRTLKIRLDVHNRDLVLRPGMFVDVELPIQRPPALIAPADAVVDSGLRKAVYVDCGNGSFEPRTVETGWRFGDMVEITKGLEAGERVVVAGNFMLDSESRMRLAAAQAAKPEQKKPPAAVHKDPVCGMEVEPDNATPKSEYRGKTYYFCSGHCKREFDKSPAKFVDKKA